MLIPKRTKYRKQFRGKMGGIATKGNKVDFGEFGLAGNAEGWVAVVKKGKIMFEVGGVSEEKAKEALRKAGHKLPIKVRFVKREEVGGDK